jgi:hypothetical protein
MKFGYSALACPGRRVEETLELGTQAGREGAELRLTGGELIDPAMSAREPGARQERPAAAARILERASERAREPEVRIGGGPGERSGGR